MSEGTRRRGEAVGCLSASPQRGARVPWSFLPFAANGHGWRHDRSCQQTDRHSVLRTIRRFSRGSCTSGWRRTSWAPPSSRYPPRAAHPFPLLGRAGEQGSGHWLNVTSQMQPTEPDTQLLRSAHLVGGGPRAGRSML